MRRPNTTPSLELDPDYEPALRNRALVVSLPEGETLDYEFQAIEYYKDQTLQKRSPFRRFFERS